MTPVASKNTKKQDQHQQYTDRSEKCGHRSRTSKLDLYKGRHLRRGFNRHRHAHAYWYHRRGSSEETELPIA